MREVVRITPGKENQDSRFMRDIFKCRFCYKPTFTTFDVDEILSHVTEEHSRDLLLFRRRHAPGIAVFKTQQYDVRYGRVAQGHKNPARNRNSNISTPYRRPESQAKTPASQVKTPGPKAPVPLPDAPTPDLRRCTVCEIGFETGQERSIHTFVCHQQKNYAYKCVYCYDTLPSVGLLLKHFGDEHRMDRVWDDFNCPSSDMIEVVIREYNLIPFCKTCQYANFTLFSEGLACRCGIPTPGNATDSRRVHVAGYPVNNTKISYAWEGNTPPSSYVSKGVGYKLEAPMPTIEDMTLEECASSTLFSPPTAPLSPPSAFLSPPPPSESVDGENAMEEGEVE